MEIKLKKGTVTHIFMGLGFDLFKVQKIETKIIDTGEVDYIKDDELPKEPKVIKDWETRTETIKIRE